MKSGSLNGVGGLPTVSSAFPSQSAFAHPRGSGISGTENIIGKKRCIMGVFGALTLFSCLAADKESEHREMCGHIGTWCW